MVSQHFQKGLCLGLHRHRPVKVPMLTLSTIKDTNNGGVSIRRGLLNHIFFLLWVSVELTWGTRGTRIHYREETVWFGQCFPGKPRVLSSGTRNGLRSTTMSLRWLNPQVVSISRFSMQVNQVILKKKKNVIGKLNTKSRQINSTENLAENKEHTGVDGNIRQIGLIQKAMVWMITEGFPA